MDLLRKLSNVIFPDCCVFCGEATGLSYVCRGCVEKLRKEQDVSCAVCGNALSGCVCNKIEHVPYKKALFWYDGLTVRLIHSLKNECYAETSVYAAEKMAEKLVRDGIDKKISYITYIPREIKKVKLLGAEPSRTISENIGLIIKKPVLRILECVKKTDQKTLSAKERQENIKGAFLLSDDFISADNILLIDDVETTGATLSECASLIHAKGVKNIYVFVAAKTTYKT